VIRPKTVQRAAALKRVQTGDGQTPKRPKGENMKKEELVALGLTDDQITKVFEINGKDVNVRN
jgi:hypothetical protein